MNANYEFGNLATFKYMLLYVKILGIWHHFMMCGLLNLFVIGGNRYLFQIY